MQILKIADLQLNHSNFELNGIVISRQEVRSFISTKNSGEQGYVFNFILRDSEIDFINVSCWGSKNFIDVLSEKIEIASTAIKIKNPLVRLKTTGSNQSEEVFQPWTPSQFQLSISENISSVELLENNDKYDRFITVPIREHNDYFTLDDVCIKKTDTVDKELNLLFLIRDIGQVEEIRSKSGKLLHKLDLIIFDSTKPNFKLTIWDRELIKFAQFWQPMKNTIFANEIKIGFDDYRKTLYAVSTSRTIFIVNPSTNEGFKLYNFGKIVRLPPIMSELDEMKSKALKCTIEEAKKLIAQNMFPSEYLLLNGFVSSFNIDSDFKKFFVKRCKGCNLIIDQPNGKCVKRTCDALKNQANSFYKNFEISISVSDHASTMNDIRSSAKPFEKFLGLQIDESLNNEKVTDIKWRVLLERLSILVQVKSIINEDENNNTLIKYSYRLIHLDHLVDGSL